jgi:hypothetical protein
VFSSLLALAMRMWVWRDELDETRWWNVPYFIVLIAIFLGTAPLLSRQLSMITSNMRTIDVLEKDAWDREQLKASVNRSRSTVSSRTAQGAPIVPSSRGRQEWKHPWGDLGVVENVALGFGFELCINKILSGKCFGGREGGSCG